MSGNIQGQFSQFTKVLNSWCRPLGFLLGLPFALVALVLSIIGAAIWIIGSLVSCLCPCCICFAAIADFVVYLVELPIRIILWFTDQIPC